MTVQSLYKSAAGEKAVMDIYDTALANWPVPHETRTVPTRHGDAFVVVSGTESAPPLVLLHGAGSNSGIWVGDVAHYVPDYCVYAVDLLGEAGRSAPNRPPWEGFAYAEWLADVFDALKIDQAVLIGISQGAWTALKFATWKPERASKLVLLCPGGVVPDKTSFLFRALPLMMFGRRGVRRLVRTLYGDQQASEEVIDVVTLIMSQFKGRMGVLPIFADEELRRLTMPVLVVGGSRDPMRDAGKIAARLGSLLPNLKSVIVPGAGHVLLEPTRYVVPFLADGK